MRRIALAIALSGVSAGALADSPDLDIQPGATQADFHEVANDLAALFNYKSLSPAEPTGLAGFAIGVVGSYVSTDHSSAWNRLTGNKIDAIGMVGVNAQKGLPFGIDLGASYVAVPGADARLFGAEVRWALVEGGVTTPAVAIRGSFSELSGVSDVDYRSYGTDLSVSKGFGPLTPYGGVGYTWSKFEVDDQFGLRDEKPDGSRVFVGLRISTLVGITPEYEHLRGHDAFNLRFGLAF